MGPLIFCVSESKIDQTLYEVHEGHVYSHHIRGKTLALKITRAGYYWVSPVVSAIPFAMWEIDLVGQFLKPPVKYKDVVVAGVSPVVSAIPSA
ncbi:hypothetical protein LIER_27013 [Lithospermum erythrorhizon]|uniref:Uncharacterized protein n=1 Tax=Lithospermum erythrorhizon TaxID=34254 RepID=A0AAV3RDH7_LITER